MEQLNKDTSQNSTPPTDPNNWLPDYATDTWYFKHCITTDAKGTDVLDPKYELYNQRIWIGDRILVLQSRVTEIVDSYHNGILQGHWGIAKTIAIIKRKYFILEITKYVQQHVAHCQQCFVNNNISSEPTSTKTGQQQKPSKAKNKKNKPKVSPLQLSQTTDISEEEQAEIEALLPQSPKTPQKPSSRTRR